jgi:hypothetical protein
MAAEEESWLDGICNYTGPGYDLPLGGYSKIPNWQPINIVKRWKVLDAESDEGFAWKKSAEMTSADILVGCEQNANSIKAIVDTYGEDFYQITDANGIHLTLNEWQAKYHSNGLGLVALRQERDKLAGKRQTPNVINAQQPEPQKSTATKVHYPSAKDIAASLEKK